MQDFSHSERHDLDLEQTAAEPKDDLDAPFQIKLEAPPPAGDLDDKIKLTSFGFSDDTGQGDSISEWKIDLVPMWQDAPLASEHESSDHNSDAHAHCRDNDDDPTRACPSEPIGSSEIPASDSGGARNSAGCQDGKSEDEEEEFGPTDPITLVRRYLDAHDIEIQFNGTFRIRSMPPMALHPDDVTTFLNAEPPDEISILAELLLETKRNDIALTKADAQRALHLIVRRARINRRKTILNPLFQKQTRYEQSYADEEWARLATVFDLLASLTIAILGHFIWQIKQKLLDRPVIHHLAPIVFSSVQGTGKTTFARLFLRPLKELMAGPALLSDFVDRRSGDIYRFPAVLIDDVDPIHPDLVAVLKNLLTADDAQRRRLRTSMTTNIKQKATIFGTANRDIADLVIDDTGHRRFAMLPFLNGARAKEGNPQIWETVNNVDYELLWRSVDAFAPSPIIPHIDDLVRHQGKSKSDPLRDWLINLDRSSEEFLRILTRHGAGAKNLRILFCIQTGIEITDSAFAPKMARHVRELDVPFGPKVENRYGAFYPIKRKFGGEATVQRGP